MSRIHFFLFFLLAVMHARADEKYIVTTRHLTTNDGLVTNALTCGLQDAQGFVWLGTYDGLQRYDGAEFKLFSKEKSGLQSNHIANIALAANGMLWITYTSAEEQAGRKIDLLDPVTGKVKPLRNAFAHQLPVPEEEIFLVLNNEVGNIFIITFNSDVWMYQAGHFRKIYNHPVLLRLIRGTWYHKITKTHLWLATAEGGTVYADTLGHWGQVHLPDGATSLPLAAYPDGRALLWVTYPSANPNLSRPQFVMATPNGTTTPASFNPYKGYRANTYEDYYLSYQWDVLSGKLVFQNHSNVVSMLMDDGISILQVVDSASSQSLNNALLGACFSDKAGRYWLCTARGLFIAEVRKNSFTHYLDKLQLPTAMAMGNQARGIYRRLSGQTVVAMWDGIYEVLDSTQQIISRLPCRNPTVLYRDSNHLWGVSRDFLIDLNDRSLKKTLPGKLGISNEIWALCRYQSRLYAGTIHGIYDITGPPSTWYKLPGGDALAQDGWCCQLLVSKDGNLWAATSAGLLCIKNGRIIDRYAAGMASHRLNIPCTDVRYVHEDATGNFWLCTNGDGLIQWRRNQNSFKGYTVADGLSSNKIYSLLADGQGYYWLSSERGLMRLNPTTDKVKIYTAKDGLPDDEFNRLSYFKALDGRLYFGGIGGVVAFYPQEVNNEREPDYGAPLRIVSLMRYNTSNNQLEDVTAQLQQYGNITFGPRDGSYTLTFQQLDYEPHAHDYAYKIDGLEKQWNYITEGSLRLGNLPYGQYTLRVRGQNAWGSSTELAIAIHVPRPYYKQVWFVVMMIVVVALLILLAIRERLKSLKVANERLEATVLQRTGQLGNMLREKDLLMKEIHHRVKNNLQVITGLQQMQANRSDNPAVKAALEDSQNRVLSIAFIHQNLYQHDDMAGVEMRSFVSELASHILDVFTSPDESFHVEQEIEPVILDIDTAVPIGLIINEFFTNSCKHAFKHKENGTISIRLWQIDNGCYRLDYEDDGPGLPNNIDLGNADSLGLRLIRQLADQLDGDLQYSGSRFTLSFKDFETRNKD